MHRTFGFENWPVTFCSPEKNLPKSWTPLCLPTAPIHQAMILYGSKWQKHFRFVFAVPTVLLRVLSFSRSSTMSALPNGTWAAAALWETANNRDWDLHSDGTVVDKVSNYSVLSTMGEQKNSFSLVISATGIYVALLGDRHAQCTI